MTVERPATNWIAEKRLTHAKLTGKDTDSVCHPEAGTGQEEPLLSLPVVLRRVGFASGCFLGFAIFGV
jgi:hypothetical protein